MRAAWLAALALLPLLAVAAERDAVLLWYRQVEAGRAERVRYIATPDYLRIDDGNADNGFVLLDRARRQVFSVVPDTHTILVIDGAGELPQAPASLHIRETRTEDADAPPIDGHAVLQVQVSANDERCYSGVVVPGLLDDVGRAMAEFDRVMAVQQQRTLEATPAELRTPCFLARYLYAPARHLQRGVPVEEWSHDGKRRTLLDYDAGARVDDSLFRLPGDYLRYTVPGGAP